MNPCVYVLVSLLDKNRYIGSTTNLNRRMNEHNQGLVLSTKNRRPLQLVYFQEFTDLVEARIYETKYKKSRGLYEKAVKSGLLRRVA